MTNDENNNMVDRSKKNNSKYLKTNKKFKLIIAIVNFQI